MYARIGDAAEPITANKNKPKRVRPQLSLSKYNTRPAGKGVTHYTLHAKCVAAVPSALPVAPA